MNITKYVHSTLLVEENGKNFLIDPGNYAFEEGVLSAAAIDKLDYILITHEHLDHMHIPGIKELLVKFPDVKVVSNDSVAEILGKKEIMVQTEGDEFVALENVPHEEIFMGPSPKNVMFTIAGKLAHPGDSHHFQTSTPILALPVLASWGSTTQAVRLAEKLKPQVVIPIHDWHWSEKGRQWSYEHLETHFQEIGIRFMGLPSGETVTI